jgi:hypothetical protein
MNTKNRTSFVVAALAGMGMSGVAMAAPGYTLVQNAPSGEKNQQQLLSQVYGGSWSKSSNGRDYSSSSMSAIRLADSGVVTPTSLTTGVSGTDNKWTGPATTTIIAKAKYAADNAVFGYFDDTGSDHSFHQIFNTSNLGTEVTINLPAAFRWALKDLSTGALWTSRSSDNVGTGNYCNQTFDQLTTYKMSGRCNGQLCDEWALFWEDRPYGASDRDFNDAMITIQVCPTVPAPATAAILGLGVIGAARRRRK